MKRASALRSGCGVEAAVEARWDDCVAGIGGFAKKEIECTGGSGSRGLREFGDGPALEDGKAVAGSDGGEVEGWRSRVGEDGRRFGTSGTEEAGKEKSERGYEELHPVLHRPSDVGAARPYGQKERQKRDSAR